MSLSSKITLGLLIGTALGLFLGELASPFEMIGQIYIGLMQMTIVPYIVVSLIGNIGRLSHQDLHLLTGSGLLMYALILIASGVSTLVLAESFQDLPVSGFFSANMVESPPKIDWYALFIPANPFKAMADNHVPAVVIFCLLFGFSMMGLKENESLLDQLALIAKNLHRVNSLVVRLTPIGVMAIAAHTAGTMSLEEFERLQGFYLVFGVYSVIMTFFVLPLLVTSLTTYTYQNVMTAAKTACLTVFATGSILSVIPLMIIGLNSLFEPKADNQKHKHFAEFILPLAYPFPNCGNVGALLFIPFAAWFMGEPLDLHEEGLLLGLGFFLLFGKIFVAIPFLLNYFQLPEDLFELFLTGGVFAGRLGDVVGAMHFIVFTILATAAMKKELKIQWSRLSLHLIGIALLLMVSSFGLQSVLGHLEDQTASEQKVMTRNSTIDPQHLLARLVSKGPNPMALAPGESRLERIHRLGVLRAGILLDNLPYSYINQRGDMVGFDVDLLTRLAKDLHVSLELVPYERLSLHEQMASDDFDIAASGLSIALEHTNNIIMTEPYFVANFSLVVRDHLRRNFEQEISIANMRGLRLGVLVDGFIGDSAQEYFPNATIIPLDSPREFFENPPSPMDALAIQAESGASWTLLYPSYSVVNPFTHPIRLPISIAVAGDDSILADTLNTWISLEKMNGHLERLTDYWISGKDQTAQKHRWSILRDVLNVTP